MRTSIVLDAVDNQRGLERRLHHPTGGEAVDFVAIFDATDIKPMGNFPQNCGFRLFVQQRSSTDRTTWLSVPRFNAGGRYDGVRDGTGAIAASLWLPLVPD